MRIVMLAGLLPCLIGASPAAADLSERPDNFEACRDAAAGATLELDFCYSDEAQRVEARMGPAFDAAMRVAEEGQRASLEQSQKDFLAYRDSWCSAKGGFLGSGHNVVYAGCVIQLTEQRIKALDGFEDM